MQDSIDSYYSYIPKVSVNSEMSYLNINRNFPFTFRKTQELLIRKNSQALRIKNIYFIFN